MTITTTPRRRPVFEVDDLIDVVVDGVIVTVPCEARNERRTRLYPYPKVLNDQHGRPSTVELNNASWLVNDGLAGTLPVDCDSQRTARDLADSFIGAIAGGAVVAVNDVQVAEWCKWWIGAGNTDRARYVAALVATRVTDTNPVVGGQLLAESTSGQLVDQAPALVQTLENPEVPA